MSHDVLQSIFNTVLHTPRVDITTLVMVALLVVVVSAISIVEYRHAVNKYERLVILTATVAIIVLSIVFMVVDIVAVHGSSVRITVAWCRCGNPQVWVTEPPAPPS